MKQRKLQFLTLLVVMPVVVFIFRSQKPDYISRIVNTALDRTQSQIPVTAYDQKRSQQLSSMIVELADKVQRRTLANGLRVLVLERRTAPVVCTAMFYKVGSGNEPKKLAGISHFLEHMTFRGTKHFLGDAIDQRVTERGGMLNGFTSTDDTYYYLLLPKKDIELALRIEADRMNQCLLAASDIEAEKRIVAAEIDEQEQRPDTKLASRVLDQHFQGSSCGRSKIGYKENIQHLTRSQLMKYYRQYYQPHNAVLVVVGDIDAADVFSRVTRHFASIRDVRYRTDHNTIKIPALVSDLRIRISAPYPSSCITVAYRVPPLSDPDWPVLYVLNYILSTEETGWLDRALKDTSIAYARAYLDQAYHPTTLTIAGNLFNGIGVDRGQQALDAVIQRFHTQHVSDTELADAKQLIKVNIVYQNDSAQNIALLIGRSDLQAGPKCFLDMSSQIDAVTAADIQRVARKYLTPENRTVGWMIGTKEKVLRVFRLSAQPVLRKDSVQSFENQSTVQPVSLPAPIPAPPGATHIPPMYDIRLQNGLRILIQRRPDASFIHFAGFINAGYIRDPKGKAGLSEFCMQMLSRGTKLHSTSSINQLLNHVSASRTYTCCPEHTHINARSLRSDLPLLLDIISEELTHPTFDHKEMGRIGWELDAKRRRVSRDAYNAASDMLFATMYPPEHPLYAPSFGSYASLRHIHRNDLVTFHKRWYRPDNTTFAIVGDLDPGEVANQIQTVFSSWQKSGQLAKVSLPRQRVLTNRKTYHIQLNQHQSDVALGFPGMSKTNPSRDCAEVLNAILGRDYSSRLYRSIRRQHALAYTIKSSLFSLDDSGIWQIHMGVKPSNADKALSLAFDEIRQLRQSPPTQSEVDTARTHLQGLMALRQDDLSTLTEWIPKYLEHGMSPYAAYVPPQSLYTVTPVQVQQVAKRYLNPDKCIIVIAGNGKKG